MREMVGLNSLFKLFRKTFAPKFEGRGILPRRYYLFRALEALDEDDIDEEGYPSGSKRIWPVMRRMLDRKGSIYAS